MDSIKSIPLLTEIFSRLHARAPGSGHIHKGHSTISYNATIPSKYETYVIENSDSKGFNSTSKRFNYENTENIFPGVGYYGGQSKMCTDSPSFSKRGTGSFASKNHYKSFNPSIEVPAPNLYDVTTVDHKSDFNRANFTKNFHPNIAIQIEDKNSKLPAPNLYNIQSTLGEKNNVFSFKSKTIRDLNLLGDASKTPGPGQYSIAKANNLMSRNPASAQSVFKSKSKRDTFKPPEGPGPSDYKINGGDTSDKYIDLRFVRKHHLCLAANALKLPPTPPLPGPGKYNIAISIGEPNHYMSSPMFTSTSSRWAKPGAAIGLGIGTSMSGYGTESFPGPAHYQPSKPTKQSFHFNVANKWL